MTFTASNSLSTTTGTYVALVSVKYDCKKFVAPDTSVPTLQYWNS